MEQNEKHLDLDLGSEAQQEQEVDLEEEFDLFPVLDEDNMEETAVEERLPPIQNSSLNHLDPEGNDPCFQIILVFICNTFKFASYQLGVPIEKSSKCKLVENTTFVIRTYRSYWVYIYL